MATRRIEYPMTAEEFFARPASDGREELVRGFVVREPFPGYRHGLIVSALCELLRTFVRDRGLGGGVVSEAGFVVGRRPDQVRGPDVAYVGPARHDPDRAGFVEGGADLAIEVLSADDRPGEIAARIADQFAAGARLFWVVDPEARTVTVHRPDGTRTLLLADDALDGGEVLPGLDVRVAGVFS